MTLVQWRDCYSVGAESVDGEHKALIDRINRLYDQLMAENEPLAVSTFFEDLIKAITADTGEVRAEGRALNVGRRVGTAEGRLLDDKGRLLAHATTTCLVFEFPKGGPRGT